jgi:AraC-like DNA-binding protein
MSGRGRDKLAFDRTVGERGVALERQPLEHSVEHRLPAVHALHVAELVERWNVSPDQLLAELGLSREQLSKPAAYLSIPTFERVISRACELTSEPGLGCLLGLKMRISAYGYLGFAAMTAADLRGALELACRFAPTQTTAIGLRLEQEEGSAALVIEERASLGAIREAVMFAVAVGLSRIGSSITGQELHGFVDFAFPKPAYFSRFAALVPARVRFSMPSHRLLFDARLLDLPLLLADPAALRLAREQCERELEELHERGSSIARLRSQMQRPEGGYRSLEEIAQQNHTSARTLGRKLRAQGTSYSELLDQARQSAALELLRTDLGIEAIAARLGYSDAANFTRAFRRWTGRSPRAHRAGRR